MVDFSISFAIAILYQFVGIYFMNIIYTTTCEFDEINAFRRKLQHKRQQKKTLNSIKNQYCDRCKM